MELNLIDKPGNEDEFNEYKMKAEGAKSDKKNIQVINLCLIVQAIFKKLKSAFYAS